jgi:hypothetical protein
MNIVWKIVDLERNVTDDFVTVAHWTVTAIDGNYSASAYGSVNWGGELVIPYEQLTESTVLDWVWQSVDKEVNEAAIISQVEEQKNPTKASGMPW